MDTGIGLRDSRRYMLSQMGVGTYQQYRTPIHQGSSFLQYVSSEHTGQGSYLEGSKPKEREGTGAYLREPPHMGTSQLACRKSTVLLT